MFLRQAHAIVIRVHAQHLQGLAVSTAKSSLWPGRSAPYWCRSHSSAFPSVAKKQDSCRFLCYTAPYYNRYKQVRFPPPIHIPARACAVPAFRTLSPGIRFLLRQKFSLIPVPASRYFYRAPASVFSVPVSFQLSPVPACWYSALLRPCSPFLWTMCGLWEP